MNKPLNKLYDEQFFQGQVDGSAKSAAIVLGLLYEHYQPQTVIDIGCGRGGWLAAAESLGAQKLTGLDGEWVEQDSLRSKNIGFRTVNFDEAMPRLNEKHDLCISLEVAEHISEPNAKPFVDLLCSASDTVLFSAAIKDQGGRNHVNEQWQSYWVDLFESNGYQCFDCFRPGLWHNESVKWWYRQNLFLFVGPDNKSLNSESLRLLEQPIFDVAHPIGYQGKIEFFRNQVKYPTLWFCLRCFKRYISNKLRGVSKLSD